MLSRLDGWTGRRAPGEEWRSNYRKDAWSSALSGIYVSAVGPFLGLVAAKSLHASGWLLSLMMAAPFLGNLATSLWVHRLHGRSKMPSVVIPVAFARALYLLMGLVTSAHQYTGVAFAAQFMEASSGPAYSAVMERIYPPNIRGKLTGYVRVARTLVGIAITLTVGHIIDRWGFRPVFVGASVTGLIAIVAFAQIRVPDEKDRSERSTPAPRSGGAWRVFLQDRPYRWFGLSIFVYGTGNLLLGPIYPLFVADTLHITYAQQGALVFAGMVAAAVGFVVFGRYIDRYGPVRCVFTCVAGQALRPAFYYLAHSFNWMLPAAIIGGLTDAGIEVGYLNSVLSFSPPQMVTTYQSLHSTLLGIRGVLASILAAILISLLQHGSAGYRPAFLLATGMIVIGYFMGRSIQAPADAGAIGTARLPAPGRNHARMTT